MINSVCSPPPVKYVFFTVYPERLGPSQAVKERSTKTESSRDSFFMGDTLIVKYKILTLVYY
jgi:hypothetical protein